MISCKEYAESKKLEIKNEIGRLFIKPELVVIQIGDEPSSNSYIKGKRKDCEEVGIRFRLLKYDENITTEELRNIIINLNLKEDITGIIVQLPVPKHINVKEIQSVIDPMKDVDGFHPLSKFQPCTPLGVINYLKTNNYDFCGKNAIVIGRSDIVGKPLAKMLTDLDVTVTLCHSKSNLELILSYSPIDIIFTCIDKIGYFDTSWEKQFSPYNIIDIGLGKAEDGKLCGNLSKELCGVIREHNSKYDFESVLISGVGGVGLLTRITLLENVFKAYKLRKGDL